MSAIEISIICRVYPSSKIVAIPKKTDAFDVKVYPNPFNENLFMQIDCKESCTFASN
jgi:hypothetical protein